MDSLPRITLVMPSYNQAAFLDTAINSVLQQRYDNLELILMDGGSTDGSLDIIQRYASLLHYWQSQPDAGQADALQQGFERATGKLMGWLNSDDVLLPGALQQIVKAYQENPAGGLFAGNLLWIDERDRIVRCKRHPPQASFFAHQGIFVIAQPGSFFTRQAYDTVGGLNTRLRYVMDADLYFRMLACGIRHVHVNAWLSCFRLQAASKTVAESARFAEEFEQTRIQSWPTMKVSRTWKLLYKVWQIANGNFLRMGLETLVGSGKHWRSWANQSAQAPG